MTTPARPGPALAIVGVTASGKSALAMALARRHPDIELVSADSMQVYRGMDIGTAKPTATERAEVPHHLLDVAEPWEDYSVARFQSDVAAAFAAIAARGHRAVLVGGTGLYLRAAVDDLEIPGQWPELAAALATEAAAGPEAVAALHHRLATLDATAASRMEPSNRRRIVRALEVTLGSGRPFSSFGPGLAAYPPRPFPLVGLDPGREAAVTRLEARFAAQMEAGFLEEVQALARAPRGLSPTARQALGYRELLAHVEAGAPLRECVERAILRTRQFARRQRSWFRRDPRITWIDPRRDIASTMTFLDALIDGQT